MSRDWLWSPLKKQTITSACSVQLPWEKLNEHSLPSRLLSMYSEQKSISIRPLHRELPNTGLFTPANEGAVYS